MNSLSAMESVDGWLNPDEARRLFQLAKRCTGRGVIVEIGSWKGKSTVWLCHGALAGSGAKVHAIDPHTGSPEHQKEFGQVWTFDEFKRNIEKAGVADSVVPHVDFSASAARTFADPVELVFIDGIHEFEGVNADFEAWFPKVIEGGTMAFHDTTCWPGVLRVVKDRVFKSPHFRKIRFTGSIVHGEKVARNTVGERIANRLKLCAFLLYAWKDRWRWRLIHNHLDSAFTRALVRYLKQRKERKSPLPIAAAGKGSQSCGRA